MKSYEELYDIVKNTLSESRFYHSKCVVERCIEFGKIYGEDIEKLKIAGIVHDIAKEIPKEIRLKKCEEYGLELDEIEKINTSLIHSKLGAEIAKKDFGLSEDIVNAIRWHTTGKENMTNFEKIVFLADSTGIDRTYDEAKNIYELSKQNLDKALEMALSSSIKKIINEGKLLHLDTVKAYNYLIKNKI